MRKASVISLVLALLVLSMPMFLVSAHSVQGDLVQNADPLPTVYIQPENVTAKKGEVFSVSIIIENIPADPGTAGIQFEMSWNPTILSALNMTEVMFHNATPPSEWDNIWELKNEINNTAGFVWYAYLWQDLNRAIDGGYAPISGNYTLATVTLQALEPGSTTLHLYDLIAGDPNALCLICSSDVTYVTPLLPSLIVDGNVSVTGLKEDINNDEVVDLFDALLLAQHFGSNQGDPNWDQGMDMNGDGTIDIFDVLILVRNYGKTA